MKKSVLLLVIVAFFIIHTVSAEIVLNNFEAVYNKGESLSIEVSILRSEAVNDGSLDVSLVCENVSFPLLARTVKISANQEAKFVIDNLGIPSAAEGDCQMEASLFSGEKLLEEKSSDIFGISNELKAIGDFQVNPEQLQLGSTLTLYGYLTSTKAGADDIKGLAEVYFKTTDKTYYAENVEVSENKFKFSYMAIGNKPGEYSVDVEVEDQFGNKKLFENVAKFTILDKVYIFVEPLQTQVLPGDTVKLSGELSTPSGGLVEGNIQITILDEAHDATVKDGKFSYDLKLPSNIESGDHTIKFSFEDEKGNRGSAERVIQVKAVPEEIKLVIFQTILKPQDTLEVSIYIYDQANKEINDNVKVELFDTNGKSMYLGSVESELLNITIPQYSVPGTWKLKASYQGIEAEKEIVIDKVKNVQVSLDGQIISIVNTGNVDYNEPVSAELNDGEFTINKEVSLKPGGVLTVDLADEAPAGEYNVKVTGAAVGANQFENILINGKNKISLNIIYSGLLVLVIAALAYLAIFKKRHFRNVAALHNKNMSHGQRKLIELKELKEKEEYGKPKLFTKEESIKDFRQRVLKDIRETEDKVGSSYYRSGSYGEEEKKEEDKPKGGLFSMFG